ncbi:hypothetical protein GCM10022224_092730 [Nonomuraea antimicrobica]|uniref:Lipoprotein n=1 Tax=Nonomuraea antimicrobica TaxID=561173 RepID=A0ABP7E0L3_9ACTN
MLLALVAGCGGGDPGPTAAQAGETLKTHITELIGETGLKDVQVTDPGGKDVSCGEEGAKRTYAVKSTFRGEDTGLIGEMAGALTLNWGYKVDKVFTPESYKTILKLASARTTVTLDMPVMGDVVVSGETSCIPA